MKKIKIITTHIDTGGHGYYSVSKKDIVYLGIQREISGYSGHDFTRVYLEEDQDGTLLHETCKKRNVELVVKSGYNLKFNKTYGYKHELFDWKPKAKDKVYIGKNLYTVVSNSKKKILVVRLSTTFLIPMSNPFGYIDGVIKSEL